MPLLNLALIRALVKEALADESFAQRCALNSPWLATTLDDYTFAQIIKASYQAQNLYERLEQIYHFCRNFADHSIQHHQALHEWIDDQGELPFDPFDDLHFHFAEGSACSLPARIEQYAELHQLRVNFGKRQRKQVEYWQQLFGENSQHPGFERKPGVITQTDELPAALPSNLAITQQIHRIEVEHCLDDYNTFYQQTRAFIHEYRSSGNIQTCCQKIVAFFRE